MVLFWFATVAWGLGTVLWAEVVRDVYHALSHQWPWLYRHHAWHHRVFRPDLSFTSPEIYQKAQWHNDLPECLVMLVFTGAAWFACFVTLPQYQWGALTGVLYTFSFLAGCIARGCGWDWARQATDFTHMPGPFGAAPSSWTVNRAYHWRHHFDNDRAYFSGTLTLVDKLMGTALSLKGKKIAVTGASGTMGRSLLAELHRAGAKVTAISSQTSPVVLEIDGKSVEVKTLTWQVGGEAELAKAFEKIDILVLNHGINVHAERSADAIARSYEVNAFSSWRLLERFLATIRTNRDMAVKEVWVNTSEAEVSPALSPLYELSKRTLGDLVTLRRLDAPCTIRKLILGPFKSNLNPIGIMSSDRVARSIVTAVKRDTRNIIVTVNPLTHILFPVRELLVSLYFQAFSRGDRATISPSERKTPEAETQVSH
ncbi:MAG: bifunctional sterol desaturase/short chain dehydrogenase [Cyanobacteria bacterium P01_D01_bin.123]